MQDVMETLTEWATLYGLNLLGAVLILIVGWIAAKLIRRIVRGMMERAKLDKMLVSFGGHLSYAVVMVFVIIAVINRLGVQTASMIAVLGAAGLAIGFALQGSLANLAAGVLLLAFRPFKAGDFVEAAGVSGTVDELRIFTTRLITPDNRVAIIPNAKLTGDNIINYTSRGTRRVDLVIGIEYGADVARAKEVLEEVLAADERVLDDPAPTVAVLELADSSVNLAVRPWTNADNYWDVYFGVLEAAKVRLDAEGIGIPFPQHDVHLFQQA